VSSYDKDIEFIGFTRSEIKYSVANNRWEILESFSKDTLAYMKEASKVPFGTNQWYFPKSKCSDEVSEYRTLNFHKFVQQPGNFCCNDGTCFASENVCDGARHCDSGEDEDPVIDCGRIELPNNYNKITPPSQVSLDFNINKILGINDYDSTFDVYFSINITWYDGQLKFKYLKNNSDVNILTREEKNKIWTPNVHFAFIRKSFNLNYDDKMVYIERKTEPTISGDGSKLNVSELYDGQFNPIILFSEHYIRFLCEFDGISQYPFGSEVCSFDFYLDGRANKLTDIITVMKYPKRNVIGQYEITGWDKKLHQSKSKDVIRISISLTKRPLSALMMTYLPTLLINIINQATNYITGDSKYQLLIEVNITSMVVLATIYVTVSTYLPSTAGMKPVENWLLCSLVYPFLVIITNVVLQVRI